MTEEDTLKEKKEFLETTPFQAEDYYGDTKDDHYEPLIDVIGQFGKFQIIWCFLLTMLAMPHAWEMLAMKFLARPTEFWCAKPSYLDGMSTSEWRNLSAVRVSSGRMQDIDHCSIYDVNYSDPRVLRRLREKIVDELGSDFGIRQCESFEFDESQFKNTIISRWNLVCGNVFLPKLAQSVFFAGTMVGVFLSGMASDRYGRKRVLVFLVGLFGASGLTAAFVNNFYLWTACRFFVGFSSLGMITTRMTLLIESVGAKWRPWVMNLFFGGGWIAGYATLPLAVYLIHDMFIFEIVAAVFGLAFLILAILVPESPRWLITMRKKDEAKKVIRRIADFNGRKVDEEKIEAACVLSGDSAKDKVKHTIFVLFSFPHMRRNILALSVVWFSFGMVYFGVALNTPDFGLDVYWVFALPALIDIPKLPLASYLFLRCGRRSMLTLHLALTGICLLLTAAIPKGVFYNNWPIVALAIIARILCGSCFGAGYTYTSELFPTSLRQSAVSTGSSFARVGAIIAPMVASLALLNPVAPLIVFGFVMMVASLISIAVWPDTKDIKLADTIEEGEVLSANPKFYFRCCEMCCLQFSKDNILD